MELIWWFTVSSNKKMIPDWQRRTAYSPADGQVYIPAELLGPELIVYIFANGDRQRVLFDDDHPYVPAAWAKTFKPAARELIATLEDIMLHEAARIAERGGMKPGERGEVV